MERTQTTATTYNVETFIELPYHNPERAKYISKAVKPLAERAQDVSKAVKTLAL